MNKSKFFLKDFFKNYKPKKKSIEILLNNNRKQIEHYSEEIKENTKKIGDFENTSLNLIKSQKEIYDEYQNYWIKHKTVNEMPSKDLKNLLLILFANPNEGVKKGLYEDSVQFDDFLNTLFKKNKQLYLKKLISELLYHYPDDNIFFKRLDKIHKFLDRKKSSNKSLFEANNRFHLIEKSGPSVIAKNILNTENNLNTLLADLWIKKRHLCNGIGDKIVKELCQQVRFSEDDYHKKDKKILDRFLEYLSGETNHSVSKSDTPSYESVRYSDIQPIVKTLLNPFKSKEPKKNIKKTITQFVDHRIGDPRFHSERWISMPSEKDIFLRWKIGETIKDFLALLTYTAKKDPDADRMWSYRKEFIEFYWAAGHITGAWIILGKEAFKNRSKFLKKESDNYGKITKGANPMHSVLIYRIGDLIISEWNYNGKVRIWNKGNKNTPKFYEKEYSRSDLINNSDKDISHHHAETYYWQAHLSDYIDEYTGILCPKKLQKKIDQW